MSGNTSKRAWIRPLAYIVLITVVVLLAACSQPAATPAAPAAPTKAAAAPAAPTTAAAAPAAPAAPTTAPAAAAPTAAAPAASKGSFSFKYASYMNDKNSVDVPTVWMLKEIEKRAAAIGYTVKTDYFWQESLAKAADMGDALTKGVADVAWLSPALFAAKFPLFTIPNSMPMVSSDYGAVSDLMLKMYAWEPGKKEIDAANMVLVGGASTDGYTWMGKKPLRNIDEFKGLRIAGYGLANKVFPLLGATSVSMAAPDMYTAIERGTIDGAIRPLTASLTIKLQEVSKFANNMDWYALPVPILYNKDKWNTLPPDLQKVIVDVGKETPEASYKMLVELLKGAKDTVTAAKVQVDTWPKGENAKIAAIARDKLFAEEGKSLDDKGLPGTQTIKNILEWSAAYEKAHPR